MFLFFRMQEALVRGVMEITMDTHRRTRRIFAYQVTLLIERLTFHLRQ